MEQVGFKLVLKTGDVIYGWYLRCILGKLLYDSRMNVVISRRRTQAINLRAIGQLPPLGLTLAVEK